MSMAIASALLRSKAFTAKALLVPLTRSITVTATKGGHQGGTGYWNKDWRPGPYPKTEDEKRAAAKKYGMLREDYEPYPDDGTGYGDYPMLPIVAAEQRDSHEPYTHDALKRDYGEVIHAEADLYGEDRFNPNERYLVPIQYQLLMFLSWMGFLLALFLFCQDYKIQLVKKMPKQMPGDGKKHYTFELE